MRAGCIKNFGHEKRLPCENGSYCEHSPEENITSPYLEKLLFFWQLKEAGYPLKADDLTIEEWVDLKRIKELIAR